MKYSVIIPVHNEEQNVAPLHHDVLHTMQQLGEPFEIIFVDDGSHDGTVARLQELSPITIIQLRKNFGQTAALDAGIKHATGEVIITLDGDGQNPPKEIPKLLNVMQTGNYDVVSGWRRKRQDPLAKRLISRGAHALRGVFVRDHIHDSGCSLKVYKRVCFEHLDLFGEMHRFIPAMLGWSGFTVGEVEVEHHQRRFGTTKYNWKRVIKGFVDMLGIWFWRKYANRPLHLFGALSFFLTGIGGVLLLWLFIKRIILQISLANSNLPLLSVLLIILGIQFFVSGIIIDLSVKQYFSNGRRYYSIKQVDRR